MNSLVRVFSNFKEFYSEINGATLTGAIDVIVVEQPDGEFQCSPFHVRFGKLGVLRSREKVVDIEINGEPVDIHMKLGDSGEAFFVEECPEEDMEELPDNLATSPIPTNYFPNKFADKEDEAQVDESGKAKTASDEIPLPLALPLPLPRRNSIDISRETAKEEIAPIFENQASDYSHRRYTDNTLERRNLGDKLKEYTTQKIRQQWAEHEEIFQFDAIDKDKDWINSTQTEEKQQHQEKEKQEQEQQLRQGEQEVQQEEQQLQQGEQQPQQEEEEQPSKPQDDAVIISAESQTPLHPVIALTEPTPTSKDIDKDIYIGTPTSSLVTDQLTNNCANGIRDESKGKKKRRKKSQMRKKNAQRKSSSSSSLGSNAPIDTNAAGGTINVNDEGADTISISNNTNSSNDESAVVVVDAVMTNSTSAKSSSMLTVANVSEPSIVALTAGAVAGDESPISDCGAAGSTLPETPATGVTRIPDLDIHFFSDTEVTTSSGGNGPCGMVGRSGAGRPSTPIQSDSELEISMREKDADVELLSSSASWKWGELPTPELTGDSKSSGISGPAAQAQAQRNSMLSGMFNFMKKTTKIRHQVNDGGLYLSELNAESMDPEMAAMYFPISSDTTLTKAASTRSGSEMPGMLANANDEDRESGNGTSLPHSPSSMEGQKSIDSDYDDGKPQDPKCLDFVAMSLCGGTEKGDPTDEEFEQHLVKYSDVCENPSLFASPNLVVRLNGKYYNWVAACPIVMTIITFQKPLTNDAVEQLITNAKQEAAVVGKNEVDGNPPPGAVGPSKRSWWYWRRSQAQTVSNTVATNTSNNSKTDEKNEEKMPLTEADQVVVATQTSRPNSPEVSENTLSKTTDTTLNAENTSAMVENLEDLSLASSNKSDLNKNEHFKKSLRLSSEAIKKLNLKDGLNEIEFSVTTAYQGTTRCKCCLFRWKHNDKVVISDIDGTITKSDVLGHLLPMVGKDWAQLGVAQLFSKIEQNGYKLLYLSARAIGQSRVTREYLRSIRQGDVRLPDGPLLLNPTSLISAFHREVIERKPEQFKIACLSDIRDLFPDKQPFYAGYGNRINDVWAYRAVGIPIMRIFTINTKGELKHELTQTFQSSYCSMTFIVDQLFPPIRAIDEGSIEFSNFNYWRDPIPELDLELETSNSSISVVKASNNGTTNNNHNNSEPIIANLSKNATSSVNPNSILSKSLGTIPEN